MRLPDPRFTEHLGEPAALVDVSRERDDPHTWNGALLVQFRKTHEASL
jgi:hypothetical protein